MAANLLLIATNAMLSAKRFPRANKSWEELSKDKKNWAAWKNLYKEADQKANVKNQVIGGQDQFGAAYGALKQSPSPTHQANSPPR